MLGGEFMKVVIAPDSYKGSLSSVSAAEAIAKGVKKALPSCEVISVPVADGGEGTMNSLVSATGGKKVKVSVMGPLHKKVAAEYGVLGDEKTCVIEMASASGLELINKSERNPLIATTFGTGELIKQALDDGYRHFILAVGGSATNDGGAGMLQALGLKMMNDAGDEIGLGGEALGEVTSVQLDSLDSRIKDCQFLIASDVQNPFIGPNGASHVFGPQKGASPEVVEMLDHYMGNWADVIEHATKVRLHDRPGAGAAGGIGGAFQAFFNADMKRGIDLVIEYTGLKEKMVNADCVFTGEGQCDFQTASGKTPMGVAEAARINHIPVFVLAGSIGKGIEELYEYGITSVHSLVTSPMELDEAMERSAELLADAAERVMRTFIAFQR